MVKTAEKKEIRQDFSDRMLAMLNEDRDVFIQVLREYVEDIGLGIAMEKATGETVGMDEFRTFMDGLLEEE